MGGIEMASNAVSIFANILPYIFFAVIVSVLKLRMCNMHKNNFSKCFYFFPKFKIVNFI